MEHQNKQESFQYTYSAKQQEEIRKIRNKYTEPQADKMEQLLQLDQSVTRKGTAASIAVGVIGCLILGTGMSCVMVWNLFLPGILIGLPGLGVIAAAYPLYQRITKKEREKIAPEILRLTDELLQ